MMDTKRIDAIDALLPQTQCTRCGYPDCRAYAVAIDNRQASYDQCPPGGQTGIRRLANLLGKPEIPLNSAYGKESPRTAAIIDEKRCIGCTLCIQACPVDAIVGRAKRMHTVLTAYCTGCDLCLAPCPVDCIDMIELGVLASSGNDHAPRLIELSTDEAAPDARRRYHSRQQRMKKQAGENTQRLLAKGNAKVSGHGQPPRSDENKRKSVIISAALERARARRAEAEQVHKSNACNEQNQAD